ncbi:hypothetical protein Golax_010789 [Gossypium laxum]|uniref:Uncharacterized protein n=1 Tax=Gossypium laxum TaxID=34288 RepID=A0A7J8ZK07_9ROSI|nr:hypothetical protein [Gossypium laxum]
MVLTLFKPFLAILNSCLVSMLRTPNPRLPFGWEFQCFG